MKRISINKEELAPFTVFHSKLNMESSYNSGNVKDVV